MTVAALDDLVPVILAGGSGTRLWPVSRSAFPKHLVELTGERSLLQTTALRITKLGPPGCLLTVAAAGQAVLVRRQLAQIDPCHCEHLLLEPSPRNTAAAVALAALYCKQVWGGDKVMWICPADHLMLDEDALYEAVAKGAEAARRGWLVTFGIEPNRPETGFGYIHQGRALDDAPGAFEVEKFVEKPPRPKAEAMLAQGGFKWNSGMFLMQPDAVLAELERHEPELLEGVRAAMGDAASASQGGIDAGLFAGVKSTPIDMAVMERSKRVATVPCDPKWSDVGSWHALWEISPHDERDNAVTGDVLLTESDGNFVKAEHRLVALAGVKDLAVIETADAVLVADKSRAEQVKAVVGLLGEGKAKRKEADVHPREFRPWGQFTILVDRPGYMVREVVLDPGQAMSEQLHQTRDEHWVIVEGTASVRVDGAEQRVMQDHAITVHRGQRHQLRNDTHLPLRIVETQIGDQLGEADTERFKR